MENPQLHHFATGGTIDSRWVPEADTAKPRTSSLVGEYLEKVARLANVTSETLFLKDSREMTSEDQDHIADRVAETPASQILVTSGTYLMPDIAATIVRHPMSQHFEGLERRVVISGSLIPLDGFLRSDGGFNLGMSVAVLQADINERITVVLNGRCLEAGKVRKDLSSATFDTGTANDILAYDSFMLITVGGSMDFSLNGIDGMVPSESSAVPGFLRNSVRMSRKFSAVNPFVKDSRELSEVDMKSIAHMINQSTSDHIIVTTGIYKIRELQEFLKSNLHRMARRHGDDNPRPKRIILTASRLPLNATDMTDAPFQLGYALGKLGFVEPGIHIALNGKMLGDDDDIIASVYSPKELLKLREAGIG